MEDFLEVTLEIFFEFLEKFLDLEELLEASWEAILKESM